MHPPHTMSTPFQPSRRAVYRVVYPVRERPTFSVGTDSFSVIDCSELGLRYQVPEFHRPAVGSTVGGRVRFRRGVEVQVSGEVVRVQDGTVALWFRSGAIPLAEMVAERERVESAEHGGGAPG
jgi:hypothetical protein